ncbi:hypothetical protein TNCV_445811 [Trichonephila clavipes]|nr:hypothetical protein TNCV_445811 [Trichonephila clavipes]
MFRIVIQRLVWPARFLNPIEKVWDALGRQVAGRIIIKQEHPIRALTEEWDIVNSCQNTTCVMLHLTPRWTYPVLIPFFKVPADFLDALFHFSTQIK